MVLWDRVAGITPPFLCVLFSFLPSPLHPQHVIFFLSMIIAWAVPDVPENVENEIKREKLLAYRAQQEHVGDAKKHENQSSHDEHPL